MDSSSHEKLPPFLRKTWDIVEDHSTDHIVRWSASGRSFVVMDVESFAKEILPRFFKHSNWSSFVRQLNTYGFRKIDPDRWEFANENFSKGGKDLLNSIQRRKPTLTSTMTALVGQGRPQDAGPPVQHTAPAQHQHTQGADYILAPPYPLDLRQPASVPLFHPSAQGPGPPGMAGLPAAYGMPGLAVGHDARMAGMVGTPHSRQAVGGTGGSSKPTVPMQIIMQEQQQRAPPAQQHPHPGLQQQQQQHLQQHQQQQQEQVQNMQGVTMQSVESGEAATGSGSGGPAGMDRMAVLMEEYLRPGQRILANIQQPLEPHQAIVLHDSHSTSATSGPSGSTENDDTEELRKINKRTRADLHSGRATAGAGSSSSGGPDTATWYPPNPRTATFGPFIRTHAVEYSAVPGNTSLDKDGIPLPAGITRPKPQALGITTQSLISEMAGQIGRLTQLATEVQDLRQDNAQLRHGMDMVMSRGQPAADVAPIHAILAEQNDSMWQHKLKSDEVSTGMQLQLNAQHNVQAVQQERSAALEAQARKLAFDTAEVARSLEAQNVDLARKLAFQENINQQQHNSNQQLEARVAELEHQLSGVTGRQERMLKGLEDRMMMAMSEMLVKQTPAAGPHPEGTAADAAALADALKYTLTTGASSSEEQGAASAAASPLTEAAHTETPRSDGTSSAAHSAG